MHLFFAKSPQRLLDQFHFTVRASVDCPVSGLTSHHFTAAPAATHSPLYRGKVVVSATSNTHSHAQRVSSADGMSSSAIVHIRKGCSSTANTAARYASARHIVAAQHLKRQHSDAANLNSSEIASNQRDAVGKYQQQQTQQQQRQLKQLRQQQPAMSFRNKHRTRLAEHQSGSRDLMLLQQLPSGRQSQQQAAQHRPDSQRTYFEDAVALYSMYAKDNSVAHWQKAALGLQQLLPRVRSPLQAQQVWQVTLALQAQPLLKQCARVVGGVVVGLIKVTLCNHDLSILQALIAQRSVCHFSFNKRHVDQLLLAAVAADVSLEELQALLDLVPPSSLSNRSYFVLIKAFMARQQFTEAAHCFHQMEVAGLHLTPAMKKLQQELRDIRSGQQSVTAGSQL